MRSLLLDILYAAGLVVASPFLLYRMIRHGRYRCDFGQRFGASPENYSLQPIIWIHGVSLGEVNAARTLVEEIHRQLPDYRVVVTTSTETGMDAAKKLFAPAHMVFRWPLDFSWSVARSLDRVKPRAVILMEGEIWPNFLAACNKRSIDVMVVNGRISETKGYPRYKKLGKFAARMFNRLSAICVQDEKYAELFRSLGVAAERLKVTGMLKYDTAVVDDKVAGQDALASAVGLTGDQKLIVAGGTGPGEEQMLLKMFKEVKSHHASARLAIVPRKPERFEEVARMIGAEGFSIVRRSGRPDGSTGDVPADSIILGDTMGELRKFYSLAHCVFVGRSLIPMGGSDMIEAAALGKATAFGPHTFNFPQAAQLAQHGCVQVSDIDALGRQIYTWLTEPSQAASAGAAAREFVLSQRGATKRSVAELCRLLGRVPAQAEGGISTDAIDQPAEGVACQAQI